MIWVVSGLLLLSLLCNYSLIKVLQKNNRERERERNFNRATMENLLDRLMHTTGQTWTPPPRPVMETDDEQDEEFKLQIQGWRSV